MNQYLEYYKLLNSVIDIGKKAADIILKIYDDNTYKVKIKAYESPVTTADLAANEIIVEGLTKLDSSITILSEESMLMPYEDRKDKTLLWSVDPLDGTKEFLKKNGEFTINIALIENGRPVLGLVYAPVFDELYYAVKGYGAFLEKSNYCCKLYCSTYSKDNQNLKIPCSNSHINKDTLDYINSFNNPQLIRIGSALKFMMIANSNADIYPRLAPTMEWDTAAPQIIVEEAGGQLLDFNNLLPMSYNKESLVNPSFICKSIEIE
jgi:3'(2'), 5'-bisphosphate nucleotidase